MVSSKTLATIDAAACLIGASLYVASMPPDIRTEREKLQDELLAQSVEISVPTVELTPEEKIELVERVIGDTECQLLNREYQTALRNGKHAQAQIFLEQARAGKCPWITQL